MLNTPFSPWPSFTQEEADAVSRVLLSNKVNYWTGQECREFEKEFAAWADSEYAVAVSNGTLALDLALKALQVGEGDEVIVTPRTFLASVSSVVTAGATPVFADVDLNSQNIEASTIEAAITPKTKAVIVVHLAGMPADMDHLFYSFVYINMDFTLLEDGTVNYQPNNRNGLYSRFKALFLKGKEFGYNNKVNKIILTSKDNLPRELLSKIEVKDIYLAWSEKNEYQRKNIANIFCLNFKIKKLGTVLLTQYFSELGIMTELEKINMYKKILLKYECSHDIYIKPHPKEDTNYSYFFENKIIPPEVPFQLIELISGGIDTVITCSSSVGLNTKANVIYHDQNDFVRNKND